MYIGTNNILNHIYKKMTLVFVSFKEMPSLYTLPQIQIQMLFMYSSILRVINIYE